MRKVFSRTNKVKRSSVKMNRKHEGINLKTNDALFGKKNLPAIVKERGAFTKADNYIDKTFDKAKSNTKEMKQKKKFKKKEIKKERVDKLFSDKNSKLVKDLEKNLGVSMDSFVKDYKEQIFKVKNIMKDAFKKAGRKSIDAAVRKYVKNPTLDNLNKLELTLTKATSRHSRETLKEFNKNMAKYLPMGYAAALVAQNL